MINNQTDGAEALSRAFQNLLINDRSVRITRHTETDKSITLSIMTRNGKTVDVEFGQDRSICGIYDDDEQTHVWDIYPEDFESAVEKIQFMI